MIDIPLVPRLAHRLQAHRRMRGAPETVAAAASIIPTLPGIDKPSQPGWRTLTQVPVIESAAKNQGATLRDYLVALRPQHWLKNLLVFVAVLAAHRFVQPADLLRTFVAFLAFCCCASGGYLVNDLCDLQADREHPQKRSRPFASGRLPVRYARATAASLIVLGCILGGRLSALSLGIVLLYVAMTVGYTFAFKRVVLLDVVVLAALCTLRIVAGAAAITSWPSVWLLACSMFLFMSLAFIKRYTELGIRRTVAGAQAKARGYEPSDAGLLVSMGTASGYSAVTVLGLYIASSTATNLYSRHQLLWLVCPLLLYWVGYLWVVAHRGEMHHDPVVFALRDHRSRILILLMLVTGLLAI